MREAMLYHKLTPQDVRCDLCWHRCRIGLGQRGRCGVRANVEGTLYTLVFDRVALLTIDPIERHAFFHFRPGTYALALATVGCNWRCRYCANYALSQMPKGPHGRLLGRRLSPEEIVKTALTHRCQNLIYTYTEPTVFFELVYETARLGAAHGLRNLIVTNGYLTPAALRMLRPYLDAAHVDVKGFDDRRHRQMCGVRRRPVFECLRRLKAMGVWVEVTTPIVPGHNDSDDELRAIAEFLASLSYSIPWHVTAFLPAYKMEDRLPAAFEAVQRAYMIGRSAGLYYVYCHDAPGSACASTFCPQCRTVLIERAGFTVLANRIARDRCPQCGRSVDGIEMNPVPLSLHHVTAS
ncbi:Choline trimethylamine-lyase activating enzyme [bacterium HR08]|nr:Choline trimethylamine-lyase activating enzyme [bacterium HR08]